MRAIVLLAFAFVLPTARAFADAVPPAPTECPAGTEGASSHCGPACFALECSTDQPCPTGSTCKTVAMCVAERTCVGAVSQPYEVTEVTGLCPTGTCGSGSCEAMAVCVADGSSDPSSGCAGASRDGELWIVGLMTCTILGMRASNRRRRTSGRHL